MLREAVRNERPLFIQVLRIHLDVIGFAVSRDLIRNHNKAAFDF